MRVGKLSLLPILHSSLHSPNFSEFFVRPISGEAAIMIVHLTYIHNWRASLLPTRGPTSRSITFFSDSQNHLLFRQSHTMSLPTANVKEPSSRMASPATDTSTLEGGVVNEKKSSSNVVNWDGDCDPLNPQNWKPSKKWLNLLVIALIAVSTCLHSPHLHQDSSLTTLPVHSHPPCCTRRPTSDVRVPL